MIRTDLLKESISLYDVVTRTDVLERSGGNFRAKCPLHIEKSPSFYINPSKNTFHCFGCQKNGDIIAFIMYKNNIEFRDAVVFLCETYGIPQESIFVDEKFDTGMHQKKKTLVEIHVQATRYFQNNIGQEREVIDYLKKRGFTKDSVINFALGYAPAGYSGLYNYLKTLSFSDEDILSTGLVIKSSYNNGMVDRFRERIMFPIRNINGEIVAFTGRIFPLGGSRTDITKTGKYMNSPETDIYKKNQVLYGLSEGKKEILKKNRVLLVEGNVDVIMGHQCGYGEALAISGTALSEEHIKKVSSLTSNIFLCLDGDKAGIKAALRSIMLLFQSGLSISAIMLPDGKDPADILLESQSKFDNYVNSAVGIIEYICSTWHILYPNTEDPQKKKTYLFEHVFPFINEVKDPIVFDTYMQSVGKSLGIQLNHVQLYFEQYKQSVKKEEPEQVRTYIDVGLSYSMNPLEILLYMIQMKESETQIEAKKVLEEIKLELQEWTETSHVILWELEDSKMPLYEIYMNNNDEGETKEFNFIHFKHRVILYIFNQLRQYIKQQLQHTGNIDIIRKISIIDKRIDESKLQAS